MSQIPFIYSKELNESRVEYLTESTELPNEGFVVLDFTAKWCGPCQKISPEYERLSSLEELREVKFYKVDVDDSEELCSKFEIKCMPTFILLKNGEEKDRITGSNIEKLYQTLLKYVNSIQLDKSNTILGNVNSIF